ncbi:MAG: ABC transporter ATP-binding protein/permease [Lachnospiraceae bacterium]|nr:ABC transporter ATP-binding protein/permease [Lachnospiraceae bacterium]
MQNSISRITYVIRLGKYIQGMWFWMLLSILCDLIYKLLPMLISLLTAWMVSSAMTGNTGDVEQMLLLTAFLVLLSAVFAWLNMLVSHDAAYRILARLRNVAYDKIDELAPAAMEGQHSAALTNIVLEDVEQLEWFYAHTIEQIVVAVILPAVALLFLGVLSPVLPSALLPFIVLMICVPMLTSRKSNDQGISVRQEYAGLNARIVDGIQGLKDIISFGWQQEYFRLFYDSQKKYHQAQMAYAVRSGDESRKIILIMGIGSLVEEIAAVVLAVNGVINLVWLAPIFVLSTAIFGPLQEALSMSTNYGLIFGAAQRVFQLLQMKPTVDDSGVLDTMALGAGNKAEGIKVSFDHVSFAYPPEDGESVLPLLKDIHFEINPGETVALVGASGSGKTTVSRLLQRFWDVDRGKICLNGIDVRKFSLAALREIITVVPQDVYLFHMSVTDNLKLAAPDATEQEIRRAAQNAHADGFIECLPHGYDTLLGERGMRLSGGEKQRISIAQAFLKNSPVLVLDEASANLDSETERQVNLAVNQLKKGRTTMVIAHRLSTICSADRIVVLHDGIVEAAGTYEKLIESCPYFAELIGGKEYAADIRE